VAPGSLASLYSTFPVSGSVIAPSFVAPATTLGGIFTGLYLIRLKITSVIPGDGDDLDAYGSAVRMQIGDSFTNSFYSNIY